MVLLDSQWFILVAALLGGYAFVFGFLRRLNEWYYVGRLGKSQNLPPGDMGWPFFGNMPTFAKYAKSDPDSLIYNLISRYGRTGMYRTHLFGYPTVIVCSPETCRNVLKDEEHLKPGYPASAMALAGKKSFHGISSAEHKRLRKVTTSPINGHELYNYIGLIEDIVVKNLEDSSKTNTPVEFLKEAKKFTFDVITSVFFSSDREHADLALVEHLYIDLLRGMRSQSINLPGFPFYKALKARKKLVKLLKGLVDHKRRNNNNEKQQTKKDLMELLMEARDDEGEKLEDEDIIDLLLLFLLAGHESSAYGVLWSVINLTNHPHVFERAKKEQEEIMTRRPSDQKGLTHTEIRQMKYLSQVIDEMLRKTSISFANFRQAKVDFNLNGYTIPKGWKVLVWNRGVHMDPENYPSPKEFDPSRWENFKARVGQFLPFGYGSRYCPGSDLAKLEITIYLHHFLLNYRMERINPDCPITYLPIARPTDNCLARIIKVA